jgi:hypothetical protein
VIPGVWAMSQNRAGPRDRRTLCTAHLEGWLGMSANSASVADHEIMRGKAFEYRHRAEAAASPVRRTALIRLANYCEKMALAMERVMIRRAGAGAES